MYIVHATRCAVLRAIHASRFGCRLYKKHHPNSRKKDCENDYRRGLDRHLYFGKVGREIAGKFLAARLAKSSAWRITVIIALWDVGAVPPSPWGIAIPPALCAALSAWSPATVNARPVEVQIAATPIATVAAAAAATVAPVPAATAPAVAAELPIAPATTASSVDISWLNPCNADRSNPSGST